MNKIKISLFTGIALILMLACGSSANETDLPVRKSCNLERLYKDMPQNIRTDTVPAPGDYCLLIVFFG